MARLFVVGKRREGVDGNGRREQRKRETNIMKRDWN
jgi:hypothetical protein